MTPSRPESATAPDDLGHYMEAVARLRAQLRVLTRQARLVEQCFDDFDADTPHGVDAHDRVHLRNRVAELRHVLSQQRRP